jgi:hypothetical protein
MDLDKTVVLRAFNKQFFDFMDDLLIVYPTNKEIMAAKNSFMTFKNINPTSIIKVWYSKIFVPYKEPIEAGDISFFVNKDYSTELIENNVANTAKVLGMIDNLRQPIHEMDEINKIHTARHIKNLSRLSEAYGLILAGKNEF